MADTMYLGPNGSYSSTDPAIANNAANAKYADAVSAASNMSIYGTPNQRAGEASGMENAANYYGTEQSLGSSAQNYRNILANKVNQPSGLANQMTQTSNDQISQEYAKAGLSGVNSSAQDIAGQRASQAKADQTNQAESAINVANYGKSIGAGISGTEALKAAGGGMGVAGTPTPTPNYGGGIFSGMGSIICTELYKQNKITIQELSGCRDFSEHITAEQYFGYLLCAKPMVSIMKKSSFISSLWVGWARSMANNKPNRFIKIMLPVLGFIGKLRVEAHHVRQS